MSDLTQKRGCLRRQISALMEGENYNNTLLNPSWIISIKDDRNSLGILCFVKVHSRSEAGDVCSSRRITAFNFPSDISSAAFCGAGLLGVREVFSKQLRALTHGASHAVVQSVGSVGPSSGRHESHVRGFGVPSGGGILQLQLFSCSRLPTQAVDL